MRGKVCALAFLLYAGVPAFGQNRFIRLSSSKNPDELRRAAAAVAPTPQQLRWQQMEFSLFCHFGMNTFTGREWGDGTAPPDSFAPTAFDPRQWARIAKKAGAAMIILTAKHHDGFCLWPSKYTDYSIHSASWRGGKGDVVGEVAAACKEFGLKFGFYLSPWDRHEQSYGDSPKYNEYFSGQLRELLTNYGSVTEVWFDGACGEGPNGKRQVYDWPSYYRVVRELQPDAVIAVMGPDVRWVGTETGVGRETEWSVIPNIASTTGGSLDDSFIPVDRMGDDIGSDEKLSGAASLAWYPAETDVSIRPGWFYHASEDTNVKTSEELCNLYFTSVGRNSNLLLNVPPDKTGRFPVPDSASLIGMSLSLKMSFEQDLFATAKLIPSSGAVERDSTGNLSRWKPDPADTVRSLILEWEQPDVFNLISLGEEIAEGQHVAAFTIDGWNGGAWKEIARGATVGYKRILNTGPLMLKKVRLRITSARTAPILARFGLHQFSPVQSGP